MIKGLRRRGVRTLLTATAMLAGATGIALATIPGSGGIINGCYEKRTGILRVIDTESGKSCLGFETPITWNQKGEQGLQGIPGEPGAKGEQGDQGTPGIQGERGLQGVQGIQGERGLPGERGPQGVPGGLSGREVVVRRLSVDSGSTFATSALCPEGKVVVSGGYRIFSGFPTLRIRGSEPLAGVLGLEGWMVAFESTAAFVMDIYAICASPAY